MKNLRILAILLLDDENGINEQAFQQLAVELEIAGHTDILNAVNAQDGRFYLGEDDAADLLKVGCFAQSEIPVETPLGEQIEGD